jgi:hypothetical protein
MCCFGCGQRAGDRDVVLKAEGDSARVLEADAVLDANRT